MHILGTKELGLMIKHPTFSETERCNSHESTVCLAKVSNSSFVTSGVYLRSYKLIKW